MRSRCHHLRTRVVRVPVLASIALGVAAMLAAFVAGPAVPATGNAGPATVTVTPTNGLTDGQPLTIHAEVPGGTELFEIRARLCVPGTGAALFPGDVYDFGYQSAYCSKAPPGTGDNETAQAFPRGTTSGDLTFKAGVGTMVWDDEDPTTPAHHEVTCGPGSSCELVVQLQMTDNSFYYATPLCYGEGCPVDPSAAPTSAAPAAAGTAGAEGGGGKGAAAAGDGSAPPLGGPAKDAAAGSGSSGAGSVARSTGSSSGAGDGELSIANTVFGDPVVHRAVRVFTAGLAGIAGGLLIAYIVLRARKQMKGLPA